MATVNSDMALFSSPSALVEYVCKNLFYNTQFLCISPCDCAVDSIVGRSGTSHCLAMNFQARLALPSHKIQSLSATCCITCNYLWCLVWTWTLRSRACNTSRPCSATQSTLTRHRTGKDAPANLSPPATARGFPRLFVSPFTTSAEWSVGTQTYQCCGAGWFGCEITHFTKPLFSYCFIQSADCAFTRRGHFCVWHVVLK